MKKSLALRFASVAGCSFSAASSAASKASSSSGVLVYQYNTSVVEVFEGKKSRCYAGFVHPQQQFYFDRMIQDFNRHEGRVTDTIVEAKLLKRNRVEQVSLVKGENEIQLLEKSILIKLEDRRQKEEFSLDSARIFQVCN